MAQANGKNKKKTCSLEWFHIEKLKESQSLQGNDNLVCPYYWKINMCNADIGPKGGHWRADNSDCFTGIPLHSNLYLGFAYSASCPVGELCVNNVDKKAAHCLHNYILISALGHIIQKILQKLKPGRTNFCKSSFLFYLTSSHHSIPLMHRDIKKSYRLDRATRSR